MAEETLRVQRHGDAVKNVKECLARAIRSSEQFWRRAVRRPMPNSGHDNRGFILVTRGEPPPESGEDRLIARYFRPLARHPGAFGLIDDVAVLAVNAGDDVVLKADAIVGGVHFLADDPP